MGTLKLGELLPDKRNANRGTKRGGVLVESSLRDFGAGRSILIDKHGRIIAGNKTAAQAGKAGFDDVLVVRTNGKQLVAVQRMDLDLDTDATAKALAVADNRTGEVSLEWDTAILKSLESEIDLTQLWNPTELSALFDGSKPLKGMTQEPGLSYRVIVECESEKHQAQIMQRLEGEGLKCLLLIS
jgi:hypothetical protein